MFTYPLFILTISFPLLYHRNCSSGWDNISPRVGHFFSYKFFDKKHRKVWITVVFWLLLWYN